MKLRFSFKFLIVILAVVFLQVTGAAAEHWDFTYADRASLLADGWDFMARTATGAQRNTEHTSGAVVSYDQSAHPGVLRISADVGDLWLNQNDTRNSLFRDLPSDWTSVMMKLSFAPDRNYQQAGLLVYQDDDNYVQMTRNFNGGNNIVFAAESDGWARVVNSVSENATDGIYLQLKREWGQNVIAGSYSLDGMNWVGLGSVSQVIDNPRLAIVVGASPGGFPNADIERVELTAGWTAPSSILAVAPQELVFNVQAGQSTDLQQLVNVFHYGASPLDWSLSKDAEWISVATTSGKSPTDLAVTVDAAGLASGVHTGYISIDSPANEAEARLIKVVVIVNPRGFVTVSTWSQARKGAFSLSVDDGDPSCFDKLLEHNFAGTFYTNDLWPPVYYPTYFEQGMELGAHLTSHPCYEIDAERLRFEEIEPNVAGVCRDTPQPCEDTISLAWPCGYTNVSAKGIASEYFLSARGYNINQLEDKTPVDFMNLKSFNSHEHTPYPPADLKTVLDSAETQGKWANIVFHRFCNDDGAIDYAATKDLWVAPIGTVVKYIIQRDRTVLENILETADATEFSLRRLPVPFSPKMTFEDAFGPMDQITLQIDIDNAREIKRVWVEQFDYPYEILSVGGKRVLLITTPVYTTPQVVRIEYREPGQPAELSVSPQGLSFTVSAGGSVVERQLSVSNAGGGELDWTASVSSGASWLSVSPSSGSGSATLSVRADPQGLSAGTYTAAIALAGSGAVNSPQTVNVTLTVNAAVPAIALSPASLSFTVSAGGSVVERQLSVSNAGGGELDWAASVSSGASWLSVSPSSGSGSAKLSVKADPQGLSAGTYTAAIALAGSGAVNSPQTVNVTLIVSMQGAADYDLSSYADRASLLADGWDFMARTATGAQRNTEHTSGAVVSYDQSAHPGVLRISADVGDLWLNQNDTRNSLFRDLPSDWTSVMMKLSFAPDRNYQQAGLLVYQDDDNYVQMTRNFNGGNNIVFAAESDGWARVVNSVSENATDGIYLQLKREWGQNVIAGSYSLDGMNWVGLGSVSQVIDNPRLAIVVGASPGGFPNADIKRVQVIAGL